MEIDKTFILEIFKNINLSDKYKKILTTDKSLSLYKEAFTSKSVDPEKNYELFEFIGDSTAGEALVWYFYTVYPQLRCASGIKTINRLKIVHASSESFSEIALELGFLPRIRASCEELSNEDKTQHLLEDVFEAFIGVTKIILTDTCRYPGVGNQVVYDFIASIFDKKNISFDPDALYDPKTRLKELFDNKTEINPIYVNFQSPIYKQTQDQTTLLYFKSQPGIFFIGEGISKNIRDKDAAKKALEWLKEEGYKIDKHFVPFCA